MLPAGRTAGMVRCGRWPMRADVLSKGTKVKTENEPITPRCSCRQYAQASLEP